MELPISTLSADQFKTWCKDHSTDAALLLAAMARARVTRARVDAYIAPVFAGFTFPTSAETREAGGPEFVTKPEELYLCEDDSLCRDYFAACDVAHAANGYTMQPGFCPALTAAHDVIKLENAFIDEAAALTGVGRDQLWKAENRRAWLDILLKACVSAGNLSNPRRVLTAAGITV